MRAGRTGAATAAVLLHTSTLVIAAQEPDAGRPLVVLPFSPSSSSRPNEGSYPLQRLPDGGYLLDDLRFEARIAPDGRVTFKDVHLRLETRVFGIPLRSYRGAGDERPSLIGALKQSLQGNPDRALPPGVELCPQDLDTRLASTTRCRFAGAPITVVGTFDLTDEVMKWAGQGWYRYEKAKFLSATFEFRLRLAVQHHRKLLRQALADLPGRLDALWNDPGRTQREKRRIVCGLWAEVEMADPEARPAADRIVNWIRLRLPASSPSAYSAAELATCTAEGHRVFNPYE